jgi:hypothetical protein
VERFDQEAATFYSFRDRERGFVEVDDGSGESHKEPLMSMAVGLVNHDTMDFSDIREITEVAAEARRRAG